MTIQERTYTVEEFDEFVLLPENEDKLFEYIGGQPVEVLSRPYDSWIAGRIAAHLVSYIKNNDIGHVTGEGGGYCVSGEYYVPNAAYISYKKVKKLPRSGYAAQPPDLVIELLADDNLRDMRLATIKLGNYLTAGTVVWIVRPDDKSVEVYQVGKPVQTIRENGTLEGGDVLPGLSIKMSDIFK